MSGTDLGRRRRVLVVTPWFPAPGAEGVGIFNLRDVELLRREQDVTVLHLCPPAQAGSPVDEAESMRIVRVPFSFAQPATFPGAVRALKALLHTHDVLHTMALPALIPARFVRVRQPWVHTEHYSALVTPPASVRSAVSLRLLKTLFARPTETVAVSAALGRVIDQHRRRPSTVIGNEVMTPVDAVTDRAIPARMRLIAVGGLVARKGPDIAVRALALLRARGIDAELVWVGSGPLEADVRAIAAEEGVGGHVRLAGQLSPAELSSELLAADIFVLPVETETFGVAIAEGLAHGLPVVATGTGGHEEFLPREASRLVRPRTPQAVADAILDLRDDPERWSRTRIAADAARRFSPEARRDAYREVYARALAERPAAQR
ncbi:glycosyltransferase [Microbacterium paraoxydans]|uniref:glycosyltransferase n=1 Tax=Microbacterium paraoxydans TaxID=199592 RepID=UPI00164312B4|nr:glycosyltransferase [Microbacterium paraoxydans]